MEKWITRLSWSKVQGINGNDSTAYTVIQPGSLEGNTATRPLIYGC